MLIPPKKPVFKFCPYCSGKLLTKKEHGVKREYCPKSHYTHWANPAPAAAVLVHQNGKVLLIKRGIEPYKGLWQLPAGFVEWGESPQETAVKEAKEEAGVDVELEGIWDVRHVRDDPREEIILIVFKAKIVGGKIKAGDDAADVGWFSLDKLPSFSSRAHRQILDRLKNEDSRR